MIMDWSKNVGLIIPFKKFDMVRVNMDTSQGNQNCKDPIDLPILIMVTTVYHFRI